MNLDLLFNCWHSDVLFFTLRQTLQTVVDPTKVVSTKSSSLDLTTDTTSGIEIAVDVS